MIDFGFLVSLIMLGAWATLFYRAARAEDVPPLAWAGLSVLVFCFTWLYLGWTGIGGWIGCGIVQVVLFVGVGVAKGLWKEFGHDLMKPKKKRKGKKRKSTAVGETQTKPTRAGRDDPPARSASS